MKKQNCFYPKKEDIKRNWVSINAKNAVLGRLASKIAQILRGKNKPEFTGSVDVGDFVIVYNIDQIVITGKKSSQKTYYRHSRYPGGLHSIIFQDLMKKHPERIIFNAVRGMLPHNRLGRKLLTKLKVYKGSNHPHSTQNPMEISSLN